MLLERAKGIRLPPTTATRRVVLFIEGSFLLGVSGKWVRRGAGARGRARRSRSAARRPGRPGPPRCAATSAPAPRRRRAGRSRGPRLRPARPRRRRAGSWARIEAETSSRMRPRYSATRSATSPPCGSVSSKSTAQAARSLSRKAKKAWVPAAKRVAGALAGADGLGDRRQQRVAGALHAGDVEALLVAEVVVEQRLGDADGSRDLLHRHRRIAALGEEIVRRRERLLHAVAAREAGTCRCCSHPCQRYPDINLYTRKCDRPHMG